MHVMSWHVLQGNELITVSARHPRQEHALAICNEQRVIGIVARPRDDFWYSPICSAVTRVHHPDGGFFAIEFLPGEPKGARNGEDERPRWISVRVSNRHRFGERAALVRGAG